MSLASLEEVASLDTRGGEEVLHGISFKAEAGQLVALVGSSGAGKSTIASLVPRLYDVDSGAVRLAGRDVRDLSFKSIRETVGVVTQDGHLFHDSIRANLAFARPGASDDDLWDALRRARLDQLVRHLPDGLDTVVGERGYRLSGGERQRLTLARLLLSHPRVVILDEATAHLDSVSEAAVQEAIGEALTGRTALVIAHRLSTIRAADIILVIEEGRVVERGSHAELSGSARPLRGALSTRSSVMVKRIYLWRRLHRSLAEGKQDKRDGRDFKDETPLSLVECPLSSRSVSASLRQPSRKAASPLQRSCPHSHCWQETPKLLRQCTP